MKNLQYFPWEDAWLIILSLSIFGIAWAVVLKDRLATRISKFWFATMLTGGTYFFLHFTNDMLFPYDGEVTPWWLSKLIWLSGLCPTLFWCGTILARNNSTSRLIHAIWRWLNLWFLLMAILGLATEWFTSEAQEPRDFFWIYCLYILFTAGFGCFLALRLPQITFGLSQRGILFFQLCAFVGFLGVVGLAAADEINHLNPSCNVTTDDNCLLAFPLEIFLSVMVGLFLVGMSRGLNIVSRRFFRHDLSYKLGIIIIAGIGLDLLLLEACLNHGSEFLNLDGSTILLGYVVILFLYILIMWFIHYQQSDWSNKLKDFTTNYAKIGKSPAFPTLLRSVTALNVPSDREAFDTSLHEIIMTLYKALKVEWVGLNVNLGTGENKLSRIQLTVPQTLDRPSINEEDFINYTIPIGEHGYLQIGPRVDSQDLTVEDLLLADFASDRLVDVFLIKETIDRFASYLTSQTSRIDLKATDVAATLHNQVFGSVNQALTDINNLLIPDESIHSSELNEQLSQIQIALKDVALSKIVLETLQPVYPSILRTRGLIAALNETLPRRYRRLFASLTLTTNIEGKSFHRNFSTSHSEKDSEERSLALENVITTQDEILNSYLEWPKNDHIFAAIEEAIRNANKHAGGIKKPRRKVDLAIEVVWQIGSDLIIHVKDNGVGFNPDKIIPSKQFGFLLHRMLLRNYQGQYKIESTPGVGTQVIIRLPMQEGVS